MSLAGVRSNRGDAYQTFIAVGWAISMIGDAQVSALEVDSTLLDVTASPVQVDDIVVYSITDKKTYCQCKKNEPDCNAWTAASLSEELAKAARLLYSDAKAQATFYSGSPFGQLAKLREYAVAQANISAYEHGLSRELRAVHGYLVTLLARSHISAEFVFDFLVRTTFSTIALDDRTEAELRARLAIYVSAADRAYDALWNAVDRLGARLPNPTTATATTHRLAREEVIRIVEAVGSVVTPRRAEIDIRSALAKLSRVGQQWRRDIRGKRLVRQHSNSIAEAVRNGTRSILVTAGPGAGKTCTLLDAYESLVGESTILPVYVQCRSLAQATSPDERADLGYMPDFVGSVARLAETMRVSVFFDSLDVLSLSREHGALTFFLSQIDQLLAASNVSVVAASRAFDARYDARLAGREWAVTLDLGKLDWISDVAPLLQEWSVQSDSLSPETRELLTNPRNLAIFSDMLLRGVVSMGKTQQDLTREYLSVCVRDDPMLGDAAVEALERIAEEMLTNRTLEVSRVRANVPVHVEKALRSAAVIQATENGKLEFTHQTLLDVLAIHAWERRGGTLSTFVLSLPPVPFVRPAIRAYVLYLAGTERKSLGKHLRVIASSSAPHHIKRAVVETFADIEPEDTDWLVIGWLRQHTSLFDALFVRTSSFAWHRFWLEHLVPECVATRDSARLASLVYKASNFLADDPESVLNFWSRVLSHEWTDTSNLAMTIGFKIAEYAGKPTPNLEPLLKQLLELPRQDHDSLGGAVLRAVAMGAASDDLLWRYIAGEVDQESLLSFRHVEKIRCEPHVFGEKDALASRMRASDRLLDLAVNTVEQWHLIIAERYGSTTAWTDGFLRSTSYRDTHSSRDFNHVGAEDVLYRAIEAGVLERARQNSPWWSSNRLRLARSHEGAFRFWAVKALTENPHLDLALAAEIASDESMLASSLSHETAELLHAAMVHMSAEQQAGISRAIESLRTASENKHSDYLLVRHAQLVRAVPAHLRTPLMQSTIENAEARCGVIVRQAHVDSVGGAVRAPFGHERFLSADDSALVRLLQHYALPDQFTTDWRDLIGGADQVGDQLHEAASRSPVRFLHLLASSWARIPELFREGFLAGAKTYLDHLHGGLQYNKEHWKPCENPDVSALADLILIELERHPAQWERRRLTADALQAVSHVLPLGETERFAFQVLGFLRAEEPRFTSDLLTTAINSARGNAAEAAMILLTRLLDAGQNVPTLLMTATRQFAVDASEAVRAVMLRRLPYVIGKCDKLGWELFHRCTSSASASLWRLAEPCLYYAYYRQFEPVRDALARILEAAATDESEDTDEDGTALATWARISSLASLAGHIPFEELVGHLSSLDRTQAWLGATSVWTANAHLPEHRPACFDGLARALASPAGMVRAATAMQRMFDAERTILMVNRELVRQMFGALRSSPTERKHYHPHQFLPWLAEVSKADSELALSSLEELAQFLTDTGQRLYDHRGEIPRALTELFREAEERELVDKGRLLRRVIEVQDKLLTIGVHGIEEWLNAAERP